MGKHEIKKDNKTKKNGKKKGLKIFLAILLIIVILAGVGFGFIKSKLNKINYVDINEEELGINDNANEELSEFRNIVLLGLDSRDMDNTKGSRRDAIIIVSINKNTKEVNLISVYRDTYMEIEGHGLDKVTHAHAYGGPALTINTLNKNLDLNIKEFAAVNFEVVAELVDMMGGIELDIKQSEVAEMNKYIDDTSKNTGITSKKITKAGKQTVNGIQAVTYSRIRKIAGGDYKRAERMRTVLMQTFEKAKTMNISTINKIANKILPNIQTNISSNEILATIPQMASYKVNDNIGWPYKTQGITLDRWYGVPVTLETNVKELYKEVFKKEDYTPSESVQTISEKIIKKTGYK